MPLPSLSLLCFQTNFHLWKQFLLWLLKHSYSKVHVFVLVHIYTRNKVVWRISLLSKPTQTITITHSYHIYMTTYVYVYLQFGCSVEKQSQDKVNAANQEYRLNDDKSRSSSFVHQPGIRIILAAIHLSSYAFSIKATLQSTPHCNFRKNKQLSQQHFSLKLTVFNNVFFSKA